MREEEARGGVFAVTEILSYESLALCFVLQIVSTIVHYTPHNTTPHHTTPPLTNSASSMGASSIHINGSLL